MRIMLALLVGCLLSCEREQQGRRICIDGFVYEKSRHGDYFELAHGSLYSLKPCRMEKEE